MLDHRRKTLDLIRFPNFTKVSLFSSFFIFISPFFFFFLTYDSCHQSNKFFPKISIIYLAPYQPRQTFEGRERPEVSQRIFNLFSPSLPIRPRNRFDSYAIYHRASIKELPDALDWFPIEVGRAIGTLEQRCYRLLRSRCPNGTNFPWKTGRRGEGKGMDGGCNWLIDERFREQNSIPCNIIFLTILDIFFQYCSNCVRRKS